MEHKAHIDPNSVEHLRGGHIAYTVHCCGGKHQARHTIMHAGQYAEAELDRQMQDHVQQAAEEHASEVAAASFVRRRLAEAGLADVTECEPCKGGAASEA